MTAFRIAICIVITASAVGFAQESQHVRKAAVIPVEHSPHAVELSGGVWRIDDSFSSMIRISNSDRTRDITVTPVLRASDGSRVELPTRIIPRQAATLIDINSAIRSLPVQVGAALGTLGTVEVSFQTQVRSAIAASVHNIDNARSLVFESTLIPREAAASVDMHALKARLIEGMWWKEFDTVQGT
jgi:hypothetical protein